MQFLQINDMIVDISRGHLHKSGQTLALEPKVLDVLLTLAHHQGEVVTHKLLLEEVWPRAVVENNALQRCIGQLRKALDDNGRDQRLIVTYPRKGYCLAQPVIWRDAPEPPAGSQDPASRWQFHFALAAGIAMFLVVGLYLPVNPMQGNSPTPNSLAAGNSLPENNMPSEAAGIPLSLIQTDFFAIYAPDSFLVAYPRAEKDDGRQLWVRNVLEGSETRVSEQPGNYHYSAWSPDSSRLAFVHEDGCYSLLARNIHHNSRGTISQGQTETLIDCQQLLLSPQWLSETSLALIETKGQDTVISRLDVSSRKKEVIYHSEGKLPYHLSYSVQSGTLAVAQYSSQNTLELLLISPQTGEAELLYSAEAMLDKRQVWHPSWNQDSTAIMISDQGKTLNIALDGTVREQIIPYLSSQQGAN